MQPINISVKMKKHIYLLLAFILGLLVASAQEQSIDKQALQEQIRFLASDSLKGRFPGTAEDLVAATYIRDHFKNLGLTLHYEDGLQTFELTTSVEPTQNNTLSIGGLQAKFGEDYGLYSFSSNATVAAEVVFAGFGMRIQTDDLQHNDYESLDAKDKWVVVLKGDPEPDNNNSAFIPFSGARSKALFARDQGAAGIILVGGEKNSPGDEPAPFTAERTVVDVGIPVIDLRKTVADALLFQMEPRIDSLEKLMIKGNTPAHFTILPLIEAQTELRRNKVETYNISAVLPGSDSLLAGEFLILGAHYDHLGMGGRGSGSRNPDTIAVHYGADDNASGVAAVLELARHFASNETRTARSIIFTAFGAEEMGLLGSAYYARKLPVEKEQVVAMVNFDMVGRLNEHKAIAIGGTGTAVETEQLLNKLAEESELQFTYSPEGFGASDHSSFYVHDIPVFFITTGAHPDYHTHEDTFDKINFDGMTAVLGFAATLANELADMPDRLTFQEAGPRERQRSGRGFRVTLGIMPDFTAGESGGLPVGGVTAGGPAEKAGMKRGDVIVAINGLAVENIYDYMNRLNQLKRGERANVDVLRNDEKIILIVDL